MPRYQLTVRERNATTGGKRICGLGIDATIEPASLRKLAITLNRNFKERVYAVEILEPGEIAIATTVKNGGTREKNA